MRVFVEQVGSRPGPEGEYAKVKNSEVTGILVAGAAEFA